MDESDQTMNLVSHASINPESMLFHGKPVSGFTLTLHYHPLPDK